MSTIAAALPIPGQPILPPREILLVDHNGTVTDTGIGVMLVSRESNPTLLWRISAVTAPLWSSAATRLNLLLDGRAGDHKQESARVDSWYIANAHLGHPVGVRLSGSQLPLGLYPSDVILSIDGDIVTPKLIKRALIAPRPIAEVSGVDPAHIKDINVKRKRAIVTVNRQGRIITLSTNKITPDDTGEPAWSGANNPYQVPSLTNITGSSAGLGLALAYIQTLSGADLTGGQKIAATGTITLGGDGRTYIGEIAGLEEKIEGAINDGYTTLLVPQVQYRQAARWAAGRGVIILGVTTLEAATQALCEQAGTCRKLARYIEQQESQPQN